MKKMLFVFNAKAGKSQIAASLGEIINTFTAGGYLVTAYPTQCRLDAFEKIGSMAEKYDMVVVSGGDGTLSECIKGIMKSGVSVPVGYIPSGSTNDFARSVDIPAKATRAAKNVLEGKPFSIDIGSFNGEYYCYVAAFGAFTDVSYETPQNFKNLFGHLAYILEGAKRINKLEAYDLTIEHDGETYVGDFVLGLITNSFSVGGMTQLITTKDVYFDDGLFEAIFIKMPNGIMEFQSLLTKLVAGDLDPKHFLTFKSSSIRVTCDSEISWTLDGEEGGKYKVAEITNHRRAVSIIIPQKTFEPPNPSGRS